MIYTLVWREDEKKVLFGTGGKGRIYSVDRDERIALLLQQSSEQVYQLAPLDSKIYVLSNNPCYFGLLLTEQRFAGEYTGPVLDARTQASWGRVVWDAAVPEGAAVQLQSRSGNTGEPNATWTDWSPFYSKTEEQVLSPKARFLQMKVLLRTQTGKASPVFNKLTVFYLQSNIAPSVTRLEFLPPNEVFLKLPDNEEVILGVERNLAEAPAKKDELRMGLAARKSERKGFQTVGWDASDENGDTLRYALAIRRTARPSGGSSRAPGPRRSTPSTRSPSRTEPISSSSRPPTRPRTRWASSSRPTRPARPSSSTTPSPRSRGSRRRRTARRSTSLSGRGCPTPTSRRPRCSSGRGNGGSSSRSTGSPTREANRSKSR